MPDQSRNAALAQLLGLFNAGRDQMGTKKLTGPELMQRLEDRRRLNEARAMPEDTPGGGRAPMAVDRPSGPPIPGREYRAFEDQRDPPLSNQMRTEQPSGPPQAGVEYMAFEDQRNTPIRAPMRTDQPSGPPTETRYAAGEDQRYPPAAAAQKPSIPAEPAADAERDQRIADLFLMIQQARNGT